jgi:hypothetical protein
MSPTAAAVAGAGAARPAITSAEKEKEKEKEKKAATSKPLFGFSLPSIASFSDSKGSSASGGSAESADGDAAHKSDAKDKEKGKDKDTSRDKDSKDKDKGKEKEKDTDKAKDKEKEKDKEKPKEPAELLPISMEGWMSKRGRHVLCLSKPLYQTRLSDCRALKTWHRRFFRLRGAVLTYYESDPRPAEKALEVLMSLILVTLLVA